MPYGLIGSSAPHLGRSQARRQLTPDEERDLLAQQAMQRQQMQAPAGMIGSAAPKKRGGIAEMFGYDQDTSGMGALEWWFSDPSRRDAAEGKVAAARQKAAYDQELQSAGLDPMSTLAARYNPGEFWKAQSGAIAEQSTPYTLAPGAQRFGGDNSMVANNRQSDKPPEPFTLGPGQTRFGPDGMPLANVDPLPPRNGIRIAPDGTVVIGGPAEDGSQLTGPNANEKSYYKDVGSYEAGKAQRETMLNNLTKARDLVSWDSTGIVGQVMKNVGGSKAVNLGERLKTVKTLIGFDKLQQMRNNSPTGGALGAITEKELAFLQSVEGSLETIQSDKQLAEVLDEVEASIGRIAAAQDAAFAYQYQALNPGQTRGEPRSGPQGLQVIPGLDANESEEFRRLQQKFGGK